MRTFASKWAKYRLFKWKPFKCIIILIILFSCSLIIASADITIINNIPLISFIAPTPDNASTNTTGSVLINTTVSDADNDNITAWLDWNNSLVLDMRMNEVAGGTLVEDSSTYKNNGTWLGNITANVTKGLYGNALIFNGTTDKVMISASESLNTTDGMTLAACFKATNTTGDLVTKWIGSTEKSYAIFLDGGKLVFRISTNGSNTNAITSTANWNTGNWVCGVGVYNGTNMSLYVNGVSAATPVALTGTVYHSTAPVFLSGHYVRNSILPVTLDEVKIWNRALGKEEILALYNASANRLYHNFTGLTNGNYTYKAYVQDSSGAINQTELRIIQVTGQGYSIRGYVKDNSTGTPLIGAIVQTNQINQTNTSLSTITDSTGFYNFTGLSNGTYLINTSFPGYYTNSTTVTINGIDLNNVNISLSRVSPVPRTFNVSGFKINNATKIGISGWNITLANSTMQKSMLTLADGSYKFTNLINGTYNLTEELQAGWTNVSTMLQQVIINGADIMNINFTNQPPTTATFNISGFKVNDTNGNGVWDAGEMGIENWNIMLLNDTGVHLANTSTDAQGFYQFMNILPGKYNIAEEMKPGFTSTNATSIPITIENMDVTNVNFTNQPVPVTVPTFNISGFKINGSDGTGIPGWNITLGNSTGQISTTSTGSNGYYAFSGLQNGTYNVTEEMRSGFRNVTATLIEFIVSGTNITNLNFTNMPNETIIHSITGYVKDNSTGTPLIGAIVQTNQINQTNTSLSTITDSTGFYNFTGLSNGTYLINVSFPGYYTNSTTVTINGIDLNNVNISLYKSSLSNKIRYGIFQTPSIDTNLSLLSSNGGWNGGAAGMSWLVTRLEQHSSVKMVSFDDIVKNNTDIDVLIITGPHYVNENEIEPIYRYSKNHSVVLLNVAWGWKNDTGVPRLNNATYNSFFNLFGAYWSSNYMSYIDTTQYSRIKVISPFSSHNVGELIDFPNPKDVGAKIPEIRNNEAIGRTILANYSYSNGTDSNRPAIIFRTLGGHNYSIISSTGFRDYRDLDIYYDLILFTTGDTYYNLNMFPNGKPIASFQRFDDSFTTRISQKMITLPDVPFAFSISGRTPTSYGGINSTAWNQINNSGLSFDIGMHSTTHDYAFWNGSMGNSTQEYINDLTINSNDIHNWTGQFPIYFNSPGATWCDNCSEASSGTINGVKINFDVGELPFEKIWRDNTYDEESYSFVKFPRYNGTGYYDKYIIQVNSTYAGTYQRLYKADRNNLSDKVKSFMLFGFTHSVDYTSDDAFNASMDSQWTNWKLKDFDFYLAKPSALLAYKMQRDNVTLSLSGSNITLKNNNPSAINGIGINEYANTDTIGYIDGIQTNNLRWSNNITYIWTNSIAPAASKAFNFTHITPKNYKLFIDFKGNIGPKMGLTTNKFSYENNYNGSKWLNFSTNQLFKNATVNKLDIEHNNIQVPAYSQDNSINTVIIPSSDYINVTIIAWNITGDFKKEWSESSTSASITTNHIIGDLGASNPVLIKKDGVNWNTFISNSTGYINFTYGEGYSTSHTFEIIIPYSIAGYVKDNSTGTPLIGAIVQTVQTNTSLSTITNSTGFYNFTGLSNGTYLINASFPGYYTNSTTITINGVDLNNVNISLSQVTPTAPQTFNVSGYKINGSDGTGISGWNITLGNSTGLISTTSTGSNGYYTFSGLLNGTYNVSEEMRSGFRNITSTLIEFTVSGTDITNLNFTNMPNATIIHSITGYIKDNSTGTPLIGAIVQTNQTNTSLSTITNSTGFYNFTGLSNGTYIINASFPGYYTNSTTVTINGVDLNNVNMSLYKSSLSNNIPFISFIAPTPDNTSTNTTGSVLINTTVSDADNDNITAWLDWNKSLVLDMRMNEAAGGTLVEDSSTYKNNGTWSGNTTANVTRGLYGNALVFNGTTDKVMISASESLNTTDAMTLAACFKATNATGDLVTRWIAPTDKSYAIFLDGGKLVFRISTDGSNTNAITSTANWNTGNWVCGVGVYNGTNMSLYVNGVSAATPVALTGTVYHSTAPIFLSGHYVRNSNLPVALDEVKIWNRALGKEEILALYNASANRLYHNFTGLTNGNYTYKAYVQDSSGAINQTELRTIQVTGLRYSVRGYVIDNSTGTPLIGAIVQTNQTNTSLSTITNSIGFYNFTGLSNGTYLINASFPGYYTNSTTVTINGADLININITLSQVTPPVPQTFNVSGFKINGSDGTGISRWNITLANSTMQKSMLTLADGSYKFTNLINGTYNVTEETRSDFTNVSPTKVQVTINSNDAPNVNFTNQPVPVVVPTFNISGFKINGSDGTGISGWNITLGNSTGSISTISTGVNGYYTFSGLLNGTYNVTEEMRSGFRNVTSTLIEVTVSGTDITNLNFTNQPVPVVVPTFNISGFKVNDTNDNGVWNPGEMGIENWNIMLLNPDTDAEIANTTTDSMGFYKFSNLTNGTYNVTEGMMTGWMNISAMSQIINISGADVVNVNFTNALVIPPQATFSISGFKINASSGSGIPGWNITLTNSTMQTTTMTTDMNGFYEFIGLVNGTYNVSEEMRPGFTPVGATFHVETIAGQNITNVNFTNQVTVPPPKKFNISGFKINDTNGNGVWDSGEIGIENWNIILLNNTGVQLANTSTNTQGFYQFMNIFPGNYSVAEEMKPGFNPTNATSMPVIVENMDVPNVNFTNQPVPVIVPTFNISGFKINGSDGTGIPGWNITLGNSTGQISTTSTGLNGYYEFPRLQNGTYNVTEEMRSGFRNITAALIEFTVSGTDITNLNFTNMPNATIIHSITGYIKDNSTGTPLIGAIVQTMMERKQTAGSDYLLKILALIV